MENKEHLARLKQGVEAGEAWQDKNPKIRPDLREADLRRTNLSGANLFQADLRAANFCEADLSAVDLVAASLWEANLDRANLTGADLRVSLLFYQLFEQRSGVCRAPPCGLAKQGSALLVCSA